MDRNTLKYWDKKARQEIYKFLTNEKFRDEIINTVMVGEDMGPFTKFLYHFGIECKCKWGVMIDFNEYKQRIFLVDKYYKWMHKLKDEIKKIIK